MAIRTNLLNWNVINRDTDFSKYIETVSNAGVIEWLQVSSSQVAVGKARVPCTRNNGDKIFALVTIDSPVSISGNGDVYIAIDENLVNDGELMNEDWTGIATIEVWTMPQTNALKLAVKNGSTITDERNMLKKISDLEGLIDWIEERTATLEEEIGEILDKWAIDHLEESWIVWEKYTLSDTLFHQLEPISSNCTLEQNVADVSANTEIHIQRIASWTENNQLNLKLKKVWAPTQNLIVEVRRGVKVDVSSNEAYWYWDEVITSSEIAYGNITTDFAEYTVTFPESFGANQWDLLDIVLYQNWKIVNDINYYVIACDSTQYSEAYSFVAVNGETRVRSKLMPYCSSSGFAQSLLCKVNSYKTLYSTNTGWTVSSSEIYSFVAPYTWTYELIATASSNSSWVRAYMDAYSLQYDARLLRISFLWTPKTKKSWKFFVNRWDTISIRWEWVSSYKLSYDSYSIGYYINNWEDNYTDDYHLIYENLETVSTDTDILTYTVKAGWLYKVECQQVFNSGSANNFIALAINWIVRWTRDYTGTSPKVVTFDWVECKKWDVISVYKTWGISYKCWYVKLYGKYVDTPVPRILYPQKIDTIWETTQVLIYWKLWDDYITDFDFNLIASVQTWNITLWNAIWFIQLKYRWITYKIPVYW